MPLPALQLLEKKFEQQKRLFEVKKVELEREIERHIQIFEQKKGAFEKKIEEQFESHRRRFEQRLETQKRKFGVQIRRFEQKNGIRLDDEVRFIRSWIERPLSIGAVTPSSKMLARAMARYVDPHSDGPVVELGPGTGPVTAALVESGVDPSRLVLVEFNPAFCRIWSSIFSSIFLPISSRRRSNSRMWRPMLRSMTVFLSSSSRNCRSILSSKVRKAISAMTITRQNVVLVEHPLPKD